MDGKAGDIFNAFPFSGLRPPKCDIIEVNVLNGRNITDGKLTDAFDTPDPYVKAYVVGYKSLAQKTSTCNNTKNPVWNEKLKFHVNPDVNNTLRLELWEGDMLCDDPLGVQDYDLQLLPDGPDVLQTFVFDKGSVIEVILKRIPVSEPDVRYGEELSEEEKRFVLERKYRVLQALQAMVENEEDAPHDIQEVPVIAVMGSGGGMRALTCYTAGIAALQFSKLLDTVTYLAGVSGSTWSIAKLYSNSDWPNLTTADLLQDAYKFKNQFVTCLLPCVLYSLLRVAREKEKSGQHASLVDWFGENLKYCLLENKQLATLSEQKVKLEGANVPLPIYTSVRVKQRIPALDFHEWMEYTPYEVSIPKHAVSIPPNLFNSRFSHGVLVDQLPEPPLHYLIGIWGSCFSILGKNMLELNGDNYGTESEEKQPVNVENARDEDEDFQKALTEEGGILSSIMEKLMRSNAFNDRKIRSAEILNFLQGVSFNSPQNETCETVNEDNKEEEHLENAETFFTVDAGLACNLPSMALIRPQRQVDLIISFDYSVRDNDNSFPLQELKQAEKLARKDGLLFPPIDITEEDVLRDGIKECYVFKDKGNIHCPIVVHFVLLNKTFRIYKEPGVKRVFKDEIDCGDFAVFDREKTYGTYDFKYSQQETARLFSLCQYNLLNNMPTVKSAILESIKKVKQRRERSDVAWHLNQKLRQTCGTEVNMLTAADVCNSEVLKRIGCVLVDEGFRAHMGNIALARQQEAGTNMSSTQQSKNHKKSSQCSIQ